MAKTVELLKYYDSQRAMFRELYTYENNRFKHAIGKCEYWDDKMFSNLHSELYKGIYENENPHDQAEWLYKLISEDLDNILQK